MSGIDVELLLVLLVIGVPAGLFFFCYFVFALANRKLPPSKRLTFSEFSKEISVTPQEMREAIVFQELIYEEELSYLGEPDTYITDLSQDEMAEIIDPYSIKDILEFSPLDALSSEDRRNYEKELEADISKPFWRVERESVNDNESNQDEFAKARKLLRDFGEEMLREPESDGVSLYVARSEALERNIAHLDNAAKYRLLVAELRAQTEDTRGVGRGTLTDHECRLHLEYENRLSETQPWETIDIPPNRPEGKWANWQYGSGWIKVSGTIYYDDPIAGFLCAVVDFCEDTDTFCVVLEFEPDNPHDPYAIAVHAKFTGTINDTFMLGYIPAEAAKWLAENYDKDIPIAAEMVRCRTNYERTSITVCGLMPRKKEREQYELA